MRITTRLLVLMLLVVPLAGADEVIDTAVVIRNTVLREQPTQSSDVVVALPMNSAVEILERRRLWVRLSATTEGEAATGWLRFTELRFGHDGTRSAGSSATPETGGFAGFSRSVSSFLAGFRSRNSRTAQRTTSTIGIRGLTVAELEAAGPDTNALAAVTRYVASKADAEKFAGAGGLAARDVAYAGGMQ